MEKVTEWDAFKYFRRHEFVNPNAMSFKLIQMLDLARQIAGFPFRITSSFRAGGTSSHAKGLAVDIRCQDSIARYIMLEALIRVGFKRIGIYERHIHVDIDPSRVPSVAWIGSYFPEEEKHAKETDESSEFQEDF